MSAARSAVLATANPGKLRELQSLLGEDWRLIPQGELGVGPVAETGRTFLDNAMLKARHAAACTGLPAIADDSGLEVDALGGAPGVHSARYAGDVADARANNRKLLAALADVPPSLRTARFRCVMVFLSHAEDPAPVIVEGTWEGWIANAPAGAGGFGYDPVFVDSGSGRTAAQLSAEEKNARSHRGQAVRELSRRLARGRGDAENC